MINGKAIVCDLYEIASTTTDKQTKTQILNLWLNICQIKREEEVLKVGSPHTEYTLKNAQKLLNKLVIAETLKDEIIYR